MIQDDHDALVVETRVETGAKLNHKFRILRGDPMVRNGRVNKKDCWLKEPQRYC